MDNCINGFNRSGIFELYSYICRFEEIKSCKKKKELQENYAVLLAHVETELKNIKTHNQEHSAWNPLDLMDEAISSPHFYYKKKECVVYDLLYHIRNAIAHGNISVDGITKNVRVKDFDKYGNQTANALIPKEVFINIVKHVNDDIQL